MPRTHAPRHGSMQYSPRKRARSIRPRVRSWPSSSEAKLMGFAGYKAGMTHMFVMDHRASTATAGKDVFTPVTILDCPPITPFIIRSYKNSPYGLNLTGEKWPEKLSKTILKTLKKPKTSPSSLSNDGDHITVVVHTSPQDAISKKTPDILEIPVGGGSAEEKIKYAESILGKELRVSDLYKDGDFIDVTAVTKGKGFQGPVKRFGVKIQSRKAQRSGKGRHVGSLGDRHSNTRWTVPMAGQMGFHTRTEHNKRVLKIGGNGDEEITPKGGFVNYGIVKKDYVAIKGSVPGTVKRIVRFRDAMRKHPQATTPEITYISRTSKQGR